MKRIISILLALALLACFAGCGAQEKKTEGFKPSLDTKTAGTVRIVGHYSNFEALEAEFDEFAKYYPNVDLTYTCLDNYNKIIATTLATNDAPEIFFAYPWMNNGEVLANYGEDLADTALGIDLGCLRPSTLLTDDAGCVRMVPIYVTTYGMLVNEDIFEKNNIKVPETYEELIAGGEALKNAGYASPMLTHSSLLGFPLYYPYFCAGVQNNREALEALNGQAPASEEYARQALELAEDFAGHGFIDTDEMNGLENDYDAVIKRFFEGDIPMMFASANTVSGTEKRESQSAAFSEHPFRYSFRPVPSTAEGGYFLNTVSMGFAVNKNSRNLEMANEFMRFLICTKELNRMAQAKRMVTPCIDMSLDKVYAAFGGMKDSQIINASELGLADAADARVRRAGWQVSAGNMTADEAVAAFWKLE